MKKVAKLSGKAMPSTQVLSKADLARMLEAPRLATHVPDAAEASTTQRTAADQRKAAMRQVTAPLMHAALLLILLAHAHIGSH